MFKKIKDFFSRKPKEEPAYYVGELKPAEMTPMMGLSKQIEQDIYKDFEKEPPGDGCSGECAGCQCDKPNTTEGYREKPTKDYFDEFYGKEDKPKQKWKVSYYAEDKGFRIPGYKVRHKDADGLIELELYSYGTPVVQIKGDDDLNRTINFGNLKEIVLTASEAYDLHLALQKYHELKKEAKFVRVKKVPDGI